ncbi:MAG: NAD-binding protein, partial [Acidimicrobiaceae bacterium]
LLNLLWFIHAAGTAEILAIGSKLGLDLRVIQRALCASPTQSNFLQFDINSVFESGNYDDGFTIDLVCKDIQLGLALAEKTGIKVEAEVELTASASTKTVDAEIVANRFKRF